MMVYIDQPDAIDTIIDHLILMEAFDRDSLRGS